MEIAMRGKLRAQVTKLCNMSTDLIESIVWNHQDFDGETLKLEVDCLLKRLVGANENLKHANESVRPLVGEEDFERECEGILDYEDRATSIIAKLESIIERLLRMDDAASVIERNEQSVVHNVVRNEATPRSQSSTNEIKLKPMELRKFSGHFEEWLPFWEQFRATVHENESLSVAVKFNFLSNALQGKAAASIAGFLPTAACYGEAIAILKEEYGNNENIIEKYIQKLVSIKGVNSSSDVKGLRFLYNEVSSAMRTLTALEVSSSKYELMVNSILLKAIPSNLRIQYFRKTGQNNGTETTNNIKILLDFLKHEIEAVEKSLLSENENKKDHREQKFKGTATALLTNSVNPSFCVFCKNNSHHTKSCKNQISIIEKKALLKREGRCFRCATKSHTSKFCKSQWVKCEECGGRHMTTLCERKKPEHNDRSENENRAHSSSNSTSALSIFHNEQNTVYLQTAKAIIFSADSKRRLVSRIIMDNGSQRTFITQSLKDQLQLKKYGEQKMKILAFGEKTKKSTSYETVVLKMKSQYSDSVYNLTAVVVPIICSDSPPFAFEANKQLKAKGFKCADMRFASDENFPGINLLIGQDHYWTFNTDNCLTLENNLVAVDTVFGWTIQGRESDCKHANFVLNINEEVNEAVDLTQFWSLESIGIHNIESADCVNASAVNIDFIDGRYQVNLPWKLDAALLNNNKAVALKRLRALTVKLLNSNKLHEYHKQLADLLASGVIERAPALSKDENCNVYYMPHRAVHREDKATSKLRIVFDASSSEKCKLSLNDHLSQGENMVADLLSILLRFRSNRYAIVADIEKAFLQILINPVDRDVHRFWWYESMPNINTSIPDPVEYRMTRVTFGVKSSPYHLAVIIKEHLKRTEQQYGSVCNQLSESFYIDDLVISVASKAEAKILVQKAKEVMKIGNFNLRQWNSNDTDVLRSLQPEDVANVCTQKILGIKWCTKSDELSVDVNSNVEYLLSLRPTKRNVLKAMAKLFDPMGVLGPFTVRIKILLQKIWKQKIDWDKSLPEELMNEFLDWQNDVVNLKDYSINRCFIKNPFFKTELHVFSDASTQAYGAVAYIRQISPNDEVYIEFVCSKNRIRPLKQGNSEGELTIPKLELTAALIAARLQKFIVNTLRTHIDSVSLWSDSTITLDWIRGRGKQLPQYVKARVSEIIDLTNVYDWKHCDGKLNPADLLTRGVKAKVLFESELWRVGPPWLAEINSEKIGEREFIDHAFTTACVVEVPKEVNNTPILPLENYSKIKKLLRITAYVLRCRKIIKRQNAPRGDLEYAELQEAELYWIKQQQVHFFQSDMQTLINKGHVTSQSQLIMMNPVIENGIIKLRSRLNDDLQGIASKPIILPKNSHFSILLVHEAHEATLHGGTNSVLSHLRAKFWIIKGRQLIKSIINKCVVCKRLRGKPGSEPWCSIPIDRIKTSRPFETTGLDFAGPLYVKDQSNDGQSKVYILLFTCAAIRAVHLELLHNMTTESCIEALRRFIARHGAPKTIISDNARTFKRADAEFRKLEELMKTSEIQQVAVKKGILWKFIPERAAWWGGFWERLVQTVKIALKSTIGKSCLNFEELHTVIKEAEGIINARPLTYVTSDPNDFSPITPAQFLSTADLLLPAEFNSDGSMIAQAWVKRQSAIKKYLNRWKCEYLNQLRTLHIMKGKPARSITVQDIVLVHDDGKPRLQWRLGRVQSAFPGRDGRTRVCEVRLANGTVLRRPVQLLYPLEVNGSAGAENVENT